MTEGVISSVNKAKLDKAGLNQVLVQLRKPITQAKVHVIHKLTKNISALKKKKAKTELEKSKNDRKVARFVQEVQILRREPKDTIARWLVANEMSLEEVTSDKTDKLDVRLRAVVRVSEHKAVRKVLDQFRLAHPHWKSRVPKLLKTLGKKRKKEDPNDEPIGIKNKIDKVKDKDKIEMSKINNVKNRDDSNE